VVAVGAADAGKAEVQVAAAEEFAYDVADDRAPRAVLLRVTFVIVALKLGEGRLDGPVERRLPRLATAVDEWCLLGETDHGTTSLSPRGDKEAETNGGL
jgi:hypothetical protein